MIVQGTPEWFAIRAGKVTASRVADVIAKTKSGPSASRANYAAQLVAERLTGTVEPSFTNAAMQWGTEKEPDARNAYSFRYDAEVEEVGFVDHFSIPMAGASPDGLIGDIGLVEIKCPNTATHISTLLDGIVPSKYYTQIQWQLDCCDRAWCDFVSFDPRLPDEMQLFVKRVHSDADYISRLRAEVEEFLAEVASTVDRLQNAYGFRPAGNGNTILDAG